MKGILDKEEVFTVGKPLLLESNSPGEPFAVFFEDEGETGYFYALNMELDQPIVDAVQIYNVANVTDKEIPSKVQVAWSNDGLKSALLINDYVHAVFDFESERGYCRTGFPPIDDWSKQGHEWSDAAIELFN